MGLFARMLGREAKSTTTLDLWRELFGGREAKTGQRITWKNALEVTTVLACTRRIADGLATVPLKVIRKDAATGARRPADDHPLFDVLHTQPNEWQDSLQFREQIAFHVVLCGNAYCFINRVGGRIVELIPIEPGCVSVERAADYSLSYEVTAPSGQRQRFPAGAIWHIRGPSWNGWAGFEYVHLAREAIGLAVSTEEAHARLHKNGARPGGLYSVEGNLDENQHKRLRAWIEQNFSGGENAWKPMVLDRGAKWTPLGMTGVDAEHLATRRHQIEEICRAFGVMPIMVGYYDKAATYASSEQMFLAHAVHTVRPWHRRLEASMDRFLLTPRERAAGLYTKFFDGELLRGAAKDRAEFYAKALGAGGSPAWMEINEVREFEDMDPRPWGAGQPLPPSATQAAGNPPAPDNTGAGDGQD